MVAITRRAWLQGAAALAFTSPTWALRWASPHKPAGAASCAATAWGAAFHQ